jgi:tRNA (guanine-N7-)-methyltransferase
LRPGASTAVRKGRPLRKGQQQLIDHVLPRLAIALPDNGKLDPRSLFSRNRPQVWLEIGFGGGEHLAEQARANPDVGLIGCEVFLNGIATLLAQVSRSARQCAALSRGRARPARCAARRVARPGVPAVPRPWPKRRHAERRFIQPANLDLLARLMKPGAEFRVGSDDPTYIGWALAHVTRHPAFAWTAQGPADWRARTADWPQTRYESKALREGRQPVFPAIYAGVSLAWS